MRAVILVTGIVQGVGFRPFVYRTAVTKSLVGFVRNRGDAGVEIAVQGSEEHVHRFLQELKEKKPALARYDSFKVEFEEDRVDLIGFSIMKSSEERELAGSTIPPDVAICDSCIRELRDPTNIRHNYFFITCTDCGPRFTIIEKLPYDRPNTTMRSFDLCPECGSEYKNPLERRFHAQTIACCACGPRVFLANRNGEDLCYEDPIRAAGRLVEEGCIMAVKGLGGFHIVTSALKSEPIARLRQVKHRSQKPFAVMARDLEAVVTFALVTEDEKRFLMSPERPIVLLQKKESYHLSELVSPGLHNVGVMLPHSALHYMLFDAVKEPALIMTSGNQPGEPLVKDNSEAVNVLAKFVDYFLSHDRNIAHRCDDSVIRVNDGVVSPIRRSRGYAPSAIHLKRPSRSCVIALGAELMVTTCTLVGEKAFLTQHIGDIETVQNYMFLKEATDHLLQLINARPEMVACDLHPTMHTTRLAERMGERMHVGVVKVQHHHAHAASIMAEEALDELVAITCDGVGYGSDGTIWGGEVLLVEGAGFRRLAHLEPQPMPGGDLATYYPIRMATGILQKAVDVQDYLYSHADKLPSGRKEVEMLLSQLRTERYPITTSAGRILDAAAALLGLCYERTYEGEPAMKLESAGVGGEDCLRLQPEIKGGVLNTTNMLRSLYEMRTKFRVVDLAYSLQDYLAKGLATMALEIAEKHGVKTVGFTGGVSYNAQITLKIKSLIQKQGLSFYTNRQVPAGDGGLSLGQAYVASLMGKQETVIPYL